MRLRHGGWWGATLRQLLKRRRNDFCELNLELELDRTWSVVANGSGIVVCCDAGVVVVTCEGDAEDHVLSAGAAFVAARSGRLAIWALQPARLQVKRCSAAGEKAAPDTDGMVGKKERVVVLRSSP